MMYEKKRKDRGIYLGCDRSDAEPGFYQTSKAQRKAMVAAYEAGDMTVDAIARQFECTPRTVVRWARKAGIAPRWSPQLERDAKILALLKEGAMNKEIVAVVGRVGYSIISAIAAKARAAGIKLPKRMSGWDAARFYRNQQGT